MLREKSPVHTASTVWFHVCNVLEMAAVKRRSAVEGYQRPRVGHWGGRAYRRAAWRVDPSCILTAVWMQTHMSRTVHGTKYIHVCVHAGTHGRTGKTGGVGVSTRGCPFHYGHRGWTAVLRETN